MGYPAARQDEGATEAMITNEQTRGTRRPLIRLGTGATLPVMLAVIAYVATLTPAASQAAPHCMTRILADVPAEEAPEQVKSKSNGDFGPVTQVKVNRKTGRMVYCAENSYCYNSNAFEFTSPCRLKLDKEGGFGNYFTYFTR